MNPDFPEIAGANGRVLAIVGVYPTRTDAYERALVISAMELPHWILRYEGQFALSVAPENAPIIAAELARFEIERAERPPAPALETPAAPHSTASLYLCVWLMAAFHYIQLAGPKWWMDRGQAVSQLIVAGQWWSAFTALTLHADLGHIGANLAAGLVYAAFLLPIFGAGWTWLLILLTGGIGNYINAWGYRAVEHISIGSSTSVFGALGLLVAAQCAIGIRARRAVNFRELILPIGAGLGLLAYLGVGDQQTDSTAHLFGFLAGIPLGAAATWLQVGQRTPRWMQIILAWLAPAILAGCWLLAANHA